MRLGFHYHLSAINKDGNVYMPGSYGRFLDSIASFCEKIICFLHIPLPEEEILMDYRIQSSNISLIHIGLHASVPKRIITSQQLTKILPNFVEDLDVMLLRGPSPLLPIIGNICRDIPTALLIVGNQLDGIDDLPQPHWRKELIRFFWKWNISAQKRISKRSLTFVNSRILLDEYKGLSPNLIEIRTTTLNDDDLFFRDDTCQKRPINLIYAGRIDRTKGLMDIAQAVVKLNSEGDNVIFNVAGPQIDKDDILCNITKLFNQNNLDGSFVYHGYKPLAELFDLYKKCDIFVIASIHEGFPRVIWEAMAHSLPVIATRVGSIPAYIDGFAELVPPKNVDALAAAIDRLINKPEIRRYYIKNGVKLVQPNTLEKQSAVMITSIKEWLSISNE